MAERIRALWQRIRLDIQRNPGLWIGVGITAIVAVIAYLAYRQKQNASQSQVPANGYGIPDYGSSAGGSTGGLLSGGGYAPFQPSSPTSSVFTPTSSGDLTPATSFPSFPSFNFVPSGPLAPLAPVSANTGMDEPFYRGFALPASQVVGGIQNPLTASQLAHTGAGASVASVAAALGSLLRSPAVTPPAQALAPAIVGLNPIQNPTVAQETAHRGVTMPTTQTHVSVPTLIPTTIRPQTVTTRGRVA